MSVQENYLKDIADAIREKDGTEESIPANTFAERIRAISSPQSVIITDHTIGGFKIDDEFSSGSKEYPVDAWGIRITDIGTVYSITIYIEDGKVTLIFS